MLRPGGFFGKSRHAPVSSVDLKRNTISDPSTTQKPAGIGPQSATGGNLQPLGTPNHTQRQSISVNETPSQATTAQIPHESAPSQTVVKLTGSNQVVGDTNRSGSYEATEKESRDGTRPRKSVMRKVNISSI